MKRLAAIAVATAIATGAVPAYASDYANNVETSVAGLLLANFNLRYERAFGGTFAVVAGGAYAAESFFFTENKWDDYAVWKYATGTAAVRIYPLGSFDRLYVSVGGNVYQNNLEDKDSGETNKALTYMPFALVGWRFVAAGRVGIAAAAGSGYYVGDLKVGDTAVNISDVQPRAEFNVGFLF